MPLTGEPNIPTTLKHFRLIFKPTLRSLLRIFTGQIIAAKNPEAGVILPIYEWSTLSPFLFLAAGY